MEGKTMKLKNVMAAILASAMIMSVSACQSGNGGNDAETEESERDIEEEVEEANANAQSVKDQILTFLTKMDMQVCGMKLSASSTSLITISVDNGVWKVTNSTPDSFMSGKFTWSGSGSSDSSSEDIAEDELARYLAEIFPDITTAGIAAWLEGGKCMAVTFTADSSSPDAQTLALLGAGGWIEETCEWDGETEGVSKDGNIVGTTPVLGMKD